MPVSSRSSDLANDTATTEESGPTRIASPTQILLEDLLRRSLILREDWEALPAAVRDRAKQLPSNDTLVDHLVEYHLLTEYQAGRIRAGQMSGLLFGNYRVLERLGAGGMGVVFKAEHLFLRRLVALKVLPNPFEDDLQPLARFLGEIRSVAKLQHPNIVAALDAGKTRGSDLEPANWYYFVMEFVPGEDLDQAVRRHGPLPLARACDLTCQIASALAEAHQHNLVHRDIKPSNILVTAEEQAKLLDFGLARSLQDRRMTDPGAVVGSLDYMAPEQARPGNPIDHRADIYALGGVLCWCLTGKPPFPPRETCTEDLVARQNQRPPSLRQPRPDLPPELDAVLGRMMGLRPEDRFSTAQAVMGALLPFLEPASPTALVPRARKTGTIPGTVPAAAEAGRVRQILIADDEPVGRFLCRSILETDGLACDEVADGKQALAAVARKAYDLVILDIHMPEVEGPEVLRRLRDQPPCPNLKIIMLSGGISADEMARLLAEGADDYLPKPPSPAQLVARVKAVLALKEMQDRSDVLNRNLLAVNAELERGLRATAGDLAQSRNALLLALAELAELRAGQTGAHLLRLQRYCRCLAEAARRLPAFAGQIDDHFVDMLESCAPLHDIGQAGLPDHILQKVGKLDREERLIMQTHTTLGADILHRIARRHCSALALLQTAADIARHHHEAYDGTGYPDRLAGNAIPLTARLVALADVYDALRSRRPHRPALAHLFAVELINLGSPGRFDPHLLQVFPACAAEFDRIVRELPDALG